MELATNFRFIGDYASAEEILKYVIARSPKYPVAMINLAVLYQQNLKNYAEAEKYYLQFFSIDSINVSTYIDLSHMYRYQYLAKADLADDILIQGLGKHPGDLGFAVELAHYYRDTNNIAAARTYYAQAIASAEKDNNTKVAEVLRVELAALPK